MVILFIKYLPVLNQGFQWRLFVVPRRRFEMSFKMEKRPRSSSNRNWKTVFIDVLLTTISLAEPIFVSFFFVCLFVFFLFVFTLFLAASFVSSFCIKRIYFNKKRLCFADVHCICNSLFIDRHPFSAFIL